MTGGQSPVIFKDKSMDNRQSMIDMLREAAQQNLPTGSRVWLYGSRARGEAHPHSDWDVLILVDKANIEKDDFAVYAYPFVELGWKNSEDVSPQLYTINEWKAREFTPYYENVEHDKQVIYES